jgi:hypothetical protein
MGVVVTSSQEVSKNESSSSSDDESGNNDNSSSDDNGIKGKKKAKPMSPQDKAKAAQVSLIDEIETTSKKVIELMIELKSLGWLVQQPPEENSKTETKL